mmetsp:Transcript_1901/g.4054  ORF Transcript_1901/g.4054 Transcript_1901/m.4054 type:complete len:277 (-) Transcript_1901:475-1305(-)
MVRRSGLRPVTTITHLSLVLQPLLQLLLRVLTKVHLRRRFGRPLDQLAQFARPLTRHLAVLLEAALPIIREIFELLQGLPGWTLVRLVRSQLSFEHRQRGLGGVHGAVGGQILHQLIECVRIDAAGRTSHPRRQARQVRWPFIVLNGIALQITQRPARLSELLREPFVLMRERGLPSAVGLGELELPLAKPVGPFRRVLRFRIDQPIARHAPPLIFIAQLCLRFRYFARGSLLVRLEGLLLALQQRDSTALLVLELVQLALIEVAQLLFDALFGDR